jgi:hypothetical protein
MIKRRTTLEDALLEMESGALEGVTAVVVNGEWWQSLSTTVQSNYRRRCEQLGVVLRADANLSRHFVELASDPLEPPLSSERRV